MSPNKVSEIFMVFMNERTNYILHVFIETLWFEYEQKDPCYSAYIMHDVIN